MTMIWYLIALINAMALIMNLVNNHWLEAGANIICILMGSTIVWARVYMLERDSRN